MVGGISLLLLKLLWLENSKKLLNLRDYGVFLLLLTLLWLENSQKWLNVTDYEYRSQERLQYSAQTSLLPFFSWCPSSAGVLFFEVFILSCHSISLSPSFSLVPLIF